MEAALARFHVFAIEGEKIGGLQTVAENRGDVADDLALFDVGETDGTNVVERFFDDLAVMSRFKAGINTRSISPRKRFRISFSIRSQASLKAPIFRISNGIAIGRWGISPPFRRASSMITCSGSIPS